MVNEFELQNRKDVIMRARIVRRSMLAIAFGSSSSLLLAQQPLPPDATYTYGRTTDLRSFPENAAPVQGSEKYISAPFANAEYSTNEGILDETDAKKAEVEAKEEEIAAVVQKVLKEEAEKKVKAEKEAKEKAEAEGYEVGTDLGMTASWNNGLEVASKNKDFKVHVGGRYQLDAGWFSAAQQVQQNINFPYRDGVDFRRARLRVDGTMYETMDWAAEFDFVNSFVARNQPANAFGPGFNEITVTAPTDLWWQFREVPWFGQVRIGNQKEQIGFEHIVSSRFLPFMERSYNQDTFYGGTYNGFTPGIQFFRNYGQDDMGVLSGGLFKPANNVFGNGIGDGDYSVVGRATRLLWYENEGQSLFHLGISGKQATAYGMQGLLARNITFRTRDAIRVGLSGDWPVPAGINLFGDDLQQANGEMVGVYGPWTFQSEYLVSSLQDARTTAGGPLGTNAVYHGGYIQLFYFLTGEHDHYSKQTGAFERVKPKENFFLVKNRCGGRCHGLGAWQVGARYNYLDLNDEGLNGGRLHNLTTGLNWFWNPNSKMQFNYIATYRDVSETTFAPNGSGWIHGFGTRFAIDF